MPATTGSDTKEFTAAERQVLISRPADVQVPNHNDLWSFVHAWFAAFGYRVSADFFRYVGEVYDKPDGSAKGGALLTRGARFA